jgi:WD40 repeat protein
MWDPDGNQLKHVPDAHTRLISSVAWAPDGTKFVTVSHDRSLKMWDPDGKEVACVPDAHTDRILVVAWAPDGCTFVTVGRDKSFKIWMGS